ncbi:MAG: DUF6113 family protein [Candidatus Nanopelagicales bacterium]
MRAASLLVLGLFLGFVGAMLQTYTNLIGSVTLPSGAILGIVTIVLVARAGAWWVGSRWGAFAVALGWLSASLIMGSQTAAGDLILSSGTRQVAYLIGATMLLASACGYPLLPGSDNADADLDGAARPKPVDA